jgi:hypothetical protein
MIVIKHKTDIHSETQENTISSIINKSEEMPSPAYNHRRQSLAYSAVGIIFMMNDWTCHGHCDILR